LPLVSELYACTSQLLPSCNDQSHSIALTNALWPTLLLLLLLLLQGIGAAVCELEPSAVSGSLVCLLRELLGDVYADVRLTALQQVLAIGESATMSVTVLITWAVT
jgi:hypothetical protein